MSILKRSYLTILFACFCVACSGPEPGQLTGIEQDTEAHTKQNAEKRAATYAAAPELNSAQLDILPVHNSLPVEATSFAGKPLYRRKVDTLKTEPYERLIDELGQKSRLSEDEYISLGGHYVALYRFQEAIDVYSRGLQAWPKSFKLRRFRAHRYISVRELDKAIVDLNEALVLLAESQSQLKGGAVIEYRADGKSHGTYEQWIWYHIGLYYYLNGDYAQAAKAYEKCMEVTSEDQYLVGTTDWLYNSYQKSGDAQSASRVLQAISLDMKADQSHPYFKRIMLYKGLVNAEEILDFDKAVEQWTARDMTIAYGVANWLRYQGDSKTAEKLHRNILQTPFWNSWAYVVTEKEYAK